MYAGQGFKCSVKQLIKSQILSFFQFLLLYRSKNALSVLYRQFKLNESKPYIIHALLVYKLTDINFSKTDPIENLILVLTFMQL